MVTNRLFFIICVFLVLYDSKGRKNIRGGSSDSKGRKAIGGGSSREKISEEGVLIQREGKILEEAVQEKKYQEAAQGKGSIKKPVNCCSLRHLEKKYIAKTL